MQALGTLEEAKSKVLADASGLLGRAAAICSSRVNTLEQVSSLLMQLREQIAEDLNQIQHEHMILDAAEWLVLNGRCPESTKWEWNPRQTGGNDEPDLRGRVGGAIVVSAEITTSRLPQGVIDKRMANTLTKLSSMQGRLFYFVRTKAMSNRALTKVRKLQHRIEVVHLPMKTCDTIDTVSLVP